MDPARTLPLTWTWDTDYVMSTAVELTGEGWALFSNTNVAGDTMFIQSSTSGYTEEFLWESALVGWVSLGIV